MKLNPFGKLNRLHPELTLLGMSTDYSHGPLEPFWINLEPGFVAIYGKNGVGKSVLLNQLLDAGASFRNHLYVRSFPPTTGEFQNKAFWPALSIEVQHGFRGFHDDMFHFLDEESRRGFSHKIRVQALKWIVQWLDGSEDENNNELQRQLEQYSTAVAEYEAGKRRYVDVPDLNTRVEYLLSAVELLSYKCELFIQDDVVQDAFVGAFTRQLALDGTFVINKGELHVNGNMRQSFLGELLELLRDGRGENEIYYHEFVEEHGSLGGSLADWLEDQGRFSDPWHGIHLSTGVENPRWGTILSDVDLSDDFYTNETNRLYLESLCNAIADRRADLPEEDERHLYGRGETPSTTLLNETQEGVHWDPLVDDFIEQSVQEANKTFKKFLDSAPQLSCSKCPISQWFQGPPIEWGIEIDGEETLPLSSLSWAERRWASMAIRLSAPTTNVPVRLLVIDEPERGLHRRAERHLAKALRDLTSEMGVTCVVATHSPAFLSVQEARLHHLWKDTSGTSRLETLPTDIEPWVYELGLDKTDLLQLCRLVLIVEGEHDAIILKKLFKEELSQWGVQIFPLRGLRNIANATDASFIFRYTDATVLYLTDNDNHERVSDIWHRALTTEPENQLAILSEFTDSRASAEGQFLKEFASLAIDLAARHRIFSSTTYQSTSSYPMRHRGMPSVNNGDARRKGTSRDG